MAVDWSMTILNLKLQWIEWSNLSLRRIKIFYTQCFCPYYLGVGLVPLKLIEALDKIGITDCSLKQSPENVHS